MLSNRGSRSRGPVLGKRTRGGGGKQVDDQWAMRMNIIQEGLLVLGDEEVEGVDVGLSERDSGRWGIESLLVGDDMVSKNGKAFERDVLYASANMSGNLDTYHRVDMNSVNLRVRRAAVIIFPTKPLQKGIYPSVCILTIAYLENLVVELKYDLGTALVQGIVRFCQKYRGLAIVVGGPGARERNDALVPFHRQHVGVAVTLCTFFDCVEASLINALRCLNGDVAVGKAVRFFKERSQRCANVGQVGSLVHKLKVKCQLRRCDLGDLKLMQGQGRERAFEMVASKTEGVWIVRLYQSEVVDHLVVVDVKRKVIIDSEEIYPVKLSVSTLRMCGGPRANKLRVIQLYRMEKCK